MPETPKLVVGIRRVHEAAFETGVEAALVDELRVHGGIVVSLVALDGDEVVGHVAFSRVSLDADSSASGVALGPVGVLPARQRSGVGTALIVRGLEMCAAMGYRFVVVLGDPTYYGRFGFAPAAEHGLREEFGGKEFFMVLPLARGGVPSSGGLVRYAPPFDRFREPNAAPANPARA